jgi:hypothetical protein
VTAATKWTRSASGDYVIPAKQAEFIEWLLSDHRRPSNQRQWAVENEVHERTVREWKRDRRFLAEWDRRAAEKNVSTERVQAALDTLWRVGTQQGDVQAITKWLEHVNRMRPPVQVAKDEEFEELSDEELVQALALELGYDDGGS